MVFIDKLSLFGGCFIFFIKKELLKCGLQLQSGLYTEVALNTGLIVIIKIVPMYEEDWSF